MVVSTHHAASATQKEISEGVRELVIDPVLKGHVVDAATKIMVNPSGSFVLGGPAADAGLTGRKIIVDTYGGVARHGGGAFSGKDPSKVDRSAAYAARHVAKNLVAAGLAERCEVQVSYAIGRAHPDLDRGGDVRHRVEVRGGDAAARPQAFRPAAWGDHREHGAAPADLPPDSRVRPLRARRPGCALGDDRQGRRVASRRGVAARRRSDALVRLRLRDTLTGRKLAVTPRAHKAMTIYVCGVTPYDSGHMGHAFTFSMFDVLVRFLEANGTRVKYVQNITDIDDPLFERAHIEDIDWRDLAERETQVHIRDMTVLGWRPPDVMPRVSDEIKRILAAATRLKASGYAYRTDALYFDTRKYRGYGRLSHRTRRSMLRKLREESLLGKRRARRQA